MENNIVQKGSVVTFFWQLMPEAPSQKIMGTFDHEVAGDIWIIRVVDAYLQEHMFHVAKKYVLDIKPPLK